MCSIFLVFAGGERIRLRSLEASQSLEAWRLYRALKASQSPEASPVFNINFCTFTGHYQDIEYYCNVQRKGQPYTFLMKKIILFLVVFPLFRITTLGQTPNQRMLFVIDS